MKRIYFVRHAKSNWATPGQADIDRSLNSRGKRDAPRMGKRLAALGVSPDCILTSPAKRARSTTKRLAKALSVKPESTKVVDPLYGAGPEDVMWIVRGLENIHASVMVVGHNPTMTDLANEVSGLQTDNVPTCGVIAATYGVDRWEDVREEEGALDFYEYPKLV